MMMMKITGMLMIAAVHANGNFTPNGFDGETDMNVEKLFDYISNDDLGGGDREDLVLELPEYTTQGARMVPCGSCGNGWIDYTPPHDFMGDDEFDYCGYFDNMPPRCGRAKIKCKRPPDVDGDPHVHTPYGDYDMWVPLDRYTPLLEGSGFQLLGKGMGVPSTGPSHWFNGIAMKNARGTTVFEAYLPCDVTRFQATDDFAHLAVFVEGARLRVKTHVNATGFGVDARYSGRVFHSNHLEEIAVTTPDFEFTVTVMDHKKPDEDASMLNNLLTPRLHLNLAFTRLDAAKLSGFFAELDDNQKTRSAATSKLLTKPTNIKSLVKNGACVDVRA